MKQEVLCAKNLTLTLHGERILSNISFSLHRGEVLGIVGINGVGKTMLAQILAGIIRPDSGRIVLEDRELELHSPLDAIRSRIGYVGEDPQLLSNLSVAENLVVGLNSDPKLYFSRRALHRTAREILDRYNFTVPHKAIVETLAYSQMKEVQIARQLAGSPSVLIFDEFTDSFSHNAMDNLLQIFRRVTGDGVSILYTSHNHEDVTSFADRILVLRNASIVAELERPQFNRHAIQRIMTGGSTSTPPEDRPTAGPCARACYEVFRVFNLSAGPISRLSFSVQLGEIVGIAGLVGSGKSVLPQCIGGLQPIEGGTVYIDGVPLRISSPRDAVKNGIGICFEKRGEMLLSDHDPIYMNISQSVISRLGPGGILCRWRERLLAREYCQRFGIDYHINQSIGEVNHATLSKIALARCMAANPRVLLLDEPNRELDADGVATLTNILGELRHTCGIILIISKIDALAQCCDRTLVMHEGEIIGELEKGTLSYSAILQLIENKGGQKYD